MGILEKIKNGLKLSGSSPFFVCLGIIANRDQTIFLFDQT